MNCINIIITHRVFAFWKRLHFQVSFSVCVYKMRWFKWRLISLNRGCSLALFLSIWVCVRVCVQQMDFASPCSRCVAVAEEEELKFSLFNLVHKQKRARNDMIFHWNRMKSRIIADVIGVLPWIALNGIDFIAFYSIFSFSLALSESYVRR